MMRIERHEVQNVQNRIKLGFERTLSKYPSELATCHETWQAVRGAFNNSVALASSGSLVPAIREVQFAVEIASDCIACLYVCGARLPPIAIAGKPVAFASVSDNSILHASGWINAFYLACIARRTENLDALCKVPVSFLRQSTTVDPEFRYQFVEMLQSFHTEKPNAETGELMLGALELTDPDKYKLLDSDWVLHLDVQQLVLMGRLLSGDKAAFEEALVQAVQLHKKFWSKNAERQRDSTGFLSFPLTAIASLAYDNGFRFAIDSEYLPMWLVTGQ